MNIVLAVHHFPPHYVSGAEKEAYRMAKSLKERGHDISIICVEDIYSGPEEGGVDWQDTEFEGLAVRRLSYQLKSVPDRKLWEYNNPWIGEHLTAYLSERKPDIFFLVSGYLMTGSAILSANKLGIFTAIYLTDFWFLCPRITMLQPTGKISSIPINPATCVQCLGEEQRRYRWLGQLIPGIMGKYWQAQTDKIAAIDFRTNFLKETLNLANLIISPSQFLRSVYVQSGISESRITFIRQGLDILPISIKRPKPAQQSILRLAYIGQIVSHKGVHVLVDAVRSLPQANIEVSIYGDSKIFPEYTRELEHKIGNDQRIHLSGVFRGSEALEQIMASHDVLVVPSLWFENSPNAILEAFYYHVPVITSNLGGMAEMVQDGQNGFLFEPGNKSDLALKIQRLLDEKDLLQSLKDRILPVKTVSQQMDEIENLLITMISNKKPIDVLS